MKNKKKLGVNIDHIATIRNARHTLYPDPVHAAYIAEQSGADLITVHLREDRRHIKERDIKILKQTIQTSMNLEISTSKSMIDIAYYIQPEFCCLVPEKRQELTTEKGVNLIKESKKIKEHIIKLESNGIQTSVFIDPCMDQIKQAISIGCSNIEINTGKYSNCKTSKTKSKEINKIIDVSSFANANKVNVHAGHGLDYFNISKIIEIPYISVINIGHSIISRALIVGLEKAIKQIKYLIEKIK
ncbi:Pyridoxine 5'-phosphate synthase [Buchnera aphidicola (Neophyllaphis podocarpi)]|uniref:pyridoxine 5'-phosphate synthase n=1 Tax=Buchnera aphidicola TaxID=9 RepID=UPI003463E020